MDEVWMLEPCVCGAATLEPCKVDCPSRMLLEADWDEVA